MWLWGFCVLVPFIKRVRRALGRSSKPTIEPRRRRAVPPCGPQPVPSRQGVDLEELFQTHVGCVILGRALRVSSRWASQLAFPKDNEQCPEVYDGRDLTSTLLHHQRLLLSGSHGGSLTPSSEISVLTNEADDSRVQCL